MCGILTCFVWLIDFIQRVWTCTMSCCVGSAVCIAFILASMAGITLGYNYSLAEYIDLKAPKVTVYMQRGVFEDQYDDYDTLRRNDHVPVAEHNGGNNRRKLDDSIFQSGERNKDEGSLMKLAAKAPAPGPTINSDTKVNEEQILSKYSVGSLNQIKAKQTLDNMWQSADALDRIRIVKGRVKPTESSTGKGYLSPGRKAMQKNKPVNVITPTRSESARWPVQRKNEARKFALPKLASVEIATGIFREYDEPVTTRADRVKPTRPKPTRTRSKMTTARTPITERHKREPSLTKSIDEEIDTFGEKSFLDKFYSPGFKEENLMKNMKGPRRDNENFVDATRGAPARYKRENVGAVPNTSPIQKFLARNPGSRKEIENQDMTEYNESFLYNLRNFSNNLLSKEVNNSTSFAKYQSTKRISTISPLINTPLIANITLNLINITKHY